MAKKKSSKEKKVAKASVSSQAGEVAGQFLVLYPANAVQSVLLKPGDRWERRADGRTWQKKYGVGEGYATVQMLDGNSAVFVFIDVGQTSPNFVTIDPTGSVIEMSGMSR